MKLLALTNQNTRPPTVWMPSPNFGRPIRYIIIHGTGMKSNEDALNRLRDPLFQVSSHYFIDSRGNNYQLVKESEIAWHAGESCWGKDRSINFTSIGIELFNPTAGKATPYNDEQYITLISLLKYLLEKYNIQLENVLGHSDIAPDRKTDPGEYFDWERLNKSNTASKYK